VHAVAGLVLIARRLGGEPQERANAFD
jgi:hypothetical protein